MKSAFIVRCGWTALALVAGIVGFAAIAEAAETPGPGGSYSCWDRCRFGVSCYTSCYDAEQVLISCNEYHHTCGGVGGVVGQGCGDGMCHYDAFLGYENSANCPTDCGFLACDPAGDDLFGPSR